MVLNDLEPLTYINAVVLNHLLSCLSLGTEMFSLRVFGPREVTRFIAKELLRLLQTILAERGRG